MRKLTIGVLGLMALLWVTLAPSLAAGSCCPGQCCHGQACCHHGRK